MKANTVLEVMAMIDAAIEDAFIDAEIICEGYAWRDGDVFPCTRRLNHPDECIFALEAE